MESLQFLKRKMRSVQKTSKITEAMKLVSIVKLKRERELFGKIQEYYTEFYNIMSAIVNSLDNLKFLDIKNAKNSTLYIVINSSLGLCGAYNNNVNHNLLKVLDTKNDKLFLIGKKAFSYYRNKDLDYLVKEQIDMPDQDINIEAMQGIMEDAFNLYKSGEINKIKICFTKFINAMHFEPTIMQLLPIDKELMKQKNNTVLHTGKVDFFPDEEQLLEVLIPYYLHTFLYGAVVESKVCEFASRRNAMDAATNNANDLLEKYRLRFNKLRQQIITNEINEMMAGGQR